MFRVSLRSIANAHAARIGSRQIVRPGSEALARQSVPSGNPLKTTVSGTVYPLFVLSVNDPDDTTARYVP